MDGKRKNMSLIWKKLMKLVYLGERTSFLDLENLGCTQRECKPDDTIFKEHTNHEFLLLQLKNTRMGATVRTNCRVVI